MSGSRWLAMALLLGSGPAAAMGMCENTETTRAVTGYSAAKNAIVVEGKAEWCDEGDGGEERGWLRFTELVDAATGKRIARYAQSRTSKSLLLVGDSPSPNAT